MRLALKKVMENTLKNLLLVALVIFASLPLQAEWKWEEIPTINAPSILGSYHMAYDKNTERLIFTMDRGDIQSDETWTFDGERWEYLCTYYPDNDSCYLHSGGGMVYDENLHQIIDFRSCQLPGTNWPTIDVLEMDKQACWRNRMQALGGMLLVTYDTKRQRAVGLGGYNMGYVTFEFDGENFSHFILEDWDSFTGCMSYDESINKTLFFGDNSPSVESSISEWNGEVWTEVDAPLPPNTYPIEYGPLAYYPAAAGSVSTISSGTLLYKHHRWHYLLGEEETPIGRALIYFPSLQRVILITCDVNEETQVWGLTYIRDHDKPFHRP